METVADSATQGGGALGGVRLMGEWHFREVQDVSSGQQGADELRRSADWLLRASDACRSAGRVETARVLRTKAACALADADQVEWSAGPLVGRDASG